MINTLEAPACRSNSPLPQISQICHKNPRDYSPNESLFQNVPLIYFPYAARTQGPKTMNERTKNLYILTRSLALVALCRRNSHTDSEGTGGKNNYKLFFFAPCTLHMMEAAGPQACPAGFHTVRFLEVRCGRISLLAAAVRHTNPIERASLGCWLQIKTAIASNIMYASCF